MNKTININIAGSVFQIDDDAFEKLRNYLQAVNLRFRQIPDGHEALDDFEARVAEIFLSKKGVTGIITRAEIDEMIEIMGKPEDIDDGFYDDTATGFSATQRRLYRNPDDRIIAGVAGGIGAYLNFDPVWIRLAFIVTSLVWGFGFFVYIALWIALPPANDEVRMKELYGSNWRNRKLSGTQPRGTKEAHAVGGALNEIFKAIGTFFRIIFRVVLIFIGSMLTLMGFSFIVLMVAILFFNVGPWLPGSMGIENVNFTDMLPLVISSVTVPWVKILSILVIALPLAGMVYWGTKLIFRFRAKDGIVSIAALVLWVISSFALTMILVNQGISFADSGKHVERVYLAPENDSLTLTLRRELSPSEYDKVIPVPSDINMIFYTTEAGKIYGTPEVNIFTTESDSLYVEVRRSSQGPSRRIAAEKAEMIEFNYAVRNDSLLVDSYFGLPGTTRWAGSFLNVNIFMPEGSKIYVDKNIAPLIDHARTDKGNSWDLGGYWWTMTDNLLTTNK